MLDNGINVTPIYRELTSKDATASGTVNSLLLAPWGWAMTS